MTTQPKSRSAIAGLSTNPLGPFMATLRTTAALASVALALSAVPAMAQSRESFQNVDRNGDGVVSYGEATRAYPGLPKRFFQQVDDNHRARSSTRSSRTANGRRGCTPGPRLRCMWWRRFRKTPTRPSSIPWR